MQDLASLEKEQDQERETVDSAPEKREQKEDLLLTGAELLENPPDDSFQHGLQAFVTWVKSLVAPNDKT